jgi:integrase
MSENLVKLLEGKKFEITGLDDSTIKSIRSMMLEDGLSTSSINNRLQLLGLYLKLAINEGLECDESLLRNRYNLKTLTKTNIYFKEDELRVLQEANLPDHLAEVRDFFLVMCYSGLRHSDASRITPDTIKGRFIELTTKKTSKPLRIPLSGRAEAILKRYDYRLPEIGVVQFNRLIKTLCREVGFTELIQVPKMVKGVEVIRDYEKWELVSSHTGRRSCLTLLASAGVPLSDIIGISGHSTIQALEKYLLQSQSDKAESLSGLDFFS